MARTAEDIFELIRRTPFMWPDNVIHAFQSGSAMHGATGNKPSDLDIAGVYIQPVEMILGIPQKREPSAASGSQWFDADVQTWKTAGDHARSGEGDIDLSLYSLRKWAGMAATGNTTALEFLFVHGADPTYIWLEHIVGNYTDFISKKAGHHFIAFAKAMLLRLNGGATGKHGQRPELEAEFGYDVKGAMHMLRVLGEGIELMRTGRITLPRPEVPFLKDVRNGKYSREEINTMADELFALLEKSTQESALPEELDRVKISKIITEAQLVFWGFH
jgi:predicted nucleotidyltransferase